MASGARTASVSKREARVTFARMESVVVHDTEHWKQELASLANASGLGLEREERKQKQTATANSQNASRSGAHYSTRTGRFNEGTAKSRGRTGSKHGTAYSDMLFNVPENEREMWVRTRRQPLASLSRLTHRTVST